MAGIFDSVWAFWGVYRSPESPVVMQEELQLWSLKIWNGMQIVYSNGCHTGSTEPKSSIEGQDGAGGSRAL